MTPCRSEMKWAYKQVSYLCPKEPWSSEAHSSKRDVRSCGLPCLHSVGAGAGKKLGHAQLLGKSMVSEVEF